MEDSNEASAILSNAICSWSMRHLTGALLDRLTHHVHILEMNGESYRLKQSRSQKNNKAR